MASIKKRGNSYLITVSNGRDQNYRQILEYKTFTPDPSWSEKRAYKEAQKVALEFEQEVKLGPFYKCGKMLFSEFSEKWFTEYVTVSLALNTQTKYREVLDNHLLPNLGSRKLSALDSFMLQDFLNQYCTQTDYSAGTIQKIQTVLRSIFRRAYCWNIIKENPMTRVQLPRNMKKTDSLKFFTPEQAKRFLSFLSEPYEVVVPKHYTTNPDGTRHLVAAYARTEALPLQLQVLLKLLIYGGFRKGEVLALTWEDIHFDALEVAINKSAVSHQGQMLTKEPKTKGSVRTVTIPTSVIQDLKHHQEAQRAEATRLEGYWQDHNLVFTQANGTMMNYSTPYQAFKKVIARYNASQSDEKLHLPSIPLHGLRHTSATIMLANQADIVSVAARLGHTQTSTTLNTYAHAVQSADHTASTILESALEDSSL